MRSVRQSRAEIDRGIINTAAAIFAAHGLEGTSIQQVAAAVGYSKTGLLHRFPSKQALLDAVLDAVHKACEEAIAEIAAIPESPDRQRRVIALLAERTLDNPGIARFMVNAVRAGWDNPRRDEVHELATRLVGALAAPVASVEQRVRLLLGLHLITNAATLEPAFDVSMPRRELHSLVVDLATAILVVQD